MLETLYSILQQTLTITAFVLGMMMIIEFINVKTDGLWSKKLQASPWAQILIGAFMGVIPGCLGTYTVVSLYIHGVVNFPALMAALIATAGDEAFFMFSMFPGKALTITAIMFGLSIVVGGILQLTMKNKFIGLSEKSFPLHDEPECHHDHHEHTGRKNLKNMTFVRALLIGLCLLVIGLIVGGVIDEGHEHGHEHGGDEEWIRYTLLAMFSVILIIVIVAKEHFLEEHLWEHVIKVHLPKIFFWSLGVILVITLLNEYIDIQSFITNNHYLVLLLAILVGIIPQSGPHLVFVLLFAQGSIPLSVLLANSIVQDGHGALPLLAESRKAFFLSKGIKIVIGIAVGVTGLLLGF